MWSGNQPETSCSALSLFPFLRGSFPVSPCGQLGGMFFFADWGERKSFADWEERRCFADWEERKSFAEREEGEVNSQ